MLQKISTGPGFEQHHGRRRLAALHGAEVERIARGRREDVVNDGVRVREHQLRPQRNDQDARRELLVALLDLDGVAARARAQSVDVDVRFADRAAAAAHLAGDGRRLVARRAAVLVGVTCARCALRRHRHRRRRRRGRQRRNIRARAAAARTQHLEHDVVALLFSLHQLQDQLALIGQLLLEALDLGLQARDVRRGVSRRPSPAEAPAPARTPRPIRTHESCSASRSFRPESSPAFWILVHAWSSRQKPITRLVVKTLSAIGGMPSYSPFNRYSALKTARGVSTQRTPIVARHTLVT